MSEIEVRAYANILETKLGPDLSVEVVYLYNGGFYGPIESSPCSLITIEPFCPLGKRRLVLNVNHPLVKDIARFTTRAINRRNSRNKKNDKHSASSAIATAVAMGEIMISSASWCISGLDVFLPNDNFDWKMAKGLICGPQMNYITPVLHQEVLVSIPIVVKTKTNTKMSSKFSSANISTIKALAIYPKKIKKIKMLRDKAHPSKVRNLQRITCGESWERRDILLKQIWKGKKNSIGRKMNMNMTKLIMTKMTKSSRTENTRKKNNDNDRISCDAINLVSISPALPVLALAQFLQLPPDQQIEIANYNFNIDSQKLLKYPSTNRIDALKDASNILLSSDRLFCLSLFFGVPLIDRTCTLYGAIRCVNVVRKVPNQNDISNYRAKYKLNYHSSQLQSQSHDDPKDKTRENEINPPNKAHRVLEATILSRAREIWNQTIDSKKRDIIVCHSGGIDSTALLVAFLRTVEEFQLKIRGNGDGYGKRCVNRNSNAIKLVVTYDDESMSENKSFYDSHIHNLKTIDKDTNHGMDHEQSGIQVCKMHRSGRMISDLGEEFPNSLVVTGELGDQMFGSDKMKGAFVKELSLSKEDREVLNEIGHGSTDGENNEQNQNKKTRTQPEFTLDQPWKIALPDMLQRKGLLAGTSSEWINWINPQLKHAPFPIVTMQDMLWWLNFSCKWQNVSMRFMHDGGDYNPPDVGIDCEDTNNNLKGSILHFYDCHDLECWACVEEFHKKKFQDLRNWKTYKEPLKRFIYDFHSDFGYYKDKEKVGSLALSLEKEKEDRIDSIIGIYCDSDIDSTEQYLNTDTQNRSKRRLRRLKINPLEEDLCMLLDSRFLRQQGASTVGQEQIIVNPWSEDLQAFKAAPYFVSMDERQRRDFNPVTVNTLNAKCSALLPSDIVRGNSVLDLGACLGAMVHWSLFHGAKEAVALEPQKIFCDRMEHDLMRRAENTWPKQNQNDNICTSAPRERYKVVCQDARSYLSACKDESFDVVVAAGVLHCFSDPTTVISEICRVAKKFVVIESVHTMLRRKGFDYPNLAANFLEFSPMAAVNKAGNDSSFIGAASVPSKESVESMVRALGFNVADAILTSHPTKKKDTDSYCKVEKFACSPLRYFLRCERTRSTTSMTTLEDVIKNGKGNECAWEHTRSHPWTRFCVEGNSNATEEKNTGDYTPKRAQRHFESFISWDNINSQASDIVFDAKDDEFPYFVSAWGKGSNKKVFTSKGDNYVTYGYIFEGITQLSGNRRRHLISLCAGMYFCSPGTTTLEGGSGIAIIVPMTKNKNRFLFSVSGPLEENENGEFVGILPYIDGCTDSILIHPSVKGDPCLNHLHFPKGIRQTQHTHPSGRAGMVISGNGYCVVVHSDKSVTKTKLIPGMVFVIPTDAPHAFETDDSTLDVIAFHPDSDYGAEATNHPMVNRTIVNGVSASEIPSIQTKMV